MHIARVYIEGFKRFKRLDLPLNPTYNLIVGNNETGKSSVLEAIGLVLNGQYDGRLAQYAIDPYLFNAEAVSSFFAARQKGEETPPPRILIEAYLHAANDDASMAKLKGTNNTKSEDCPGLALTIEVDSDYGQELKEYAADVSNPPVLPIEYFKVTWRSFSGDAVTLRKLPFRATTIDTSRPRAQGGPNKYLANVVNDVLTESQRRDLSLEYKKLRHKFALEPGIVAINEHLEKQGNPATAKKLSIQMDMSYRGSWDSTISPHLDELPFVCAGKGEQCRVQLRLAIASADQSQIILLEEPENHLSHANLNVLLNDLKNDCAERQVIITTHSAYVLNRLGLEHLTLVSQVGQPATLNGLTRQTRDYFKKLPGYDTLRLLLARRCILVEGPSDELVVQRAYKDKHGKLPLEDGVDVISIGALAFKRFLEIAAMLKLDVSAVTDNDGDTAALEAKYKEYLGGAHPTIRICFDRDTNVSTLEPQLLGVNSLAALNSILGTTYKDGPALLKYMVRNKVDCALSLFEAKDRWAVPKYIADAIG
jgi:putative ATP-dependent endonuclease of OLD family